MPSEVQRLASHGPATVWEGTEQLTCHPGAQWPALRGRARAAPAAFCGGCVALWRFAKSSGVGRPHRRAGRLAPPQQAASFVVRVIGSAVEPWRFHVCSLCLRPSLQGLLGIQLLERSPCLDHLGACNTQELMTCTLMYADSSIMLSDSETESDKGVKTLCKGPAA